MEYIVIQDTKPSRAVMCPIPTALNPEDQAIIEAFLSTYKRYYHLRGKWVALRSTFKRLLFEYKALLNPSAGELLDRVIAAADEVNDMNEQCEMLWPVLEEAKRMCEALNQGPQDD